MILYDIEYCVYMWETCYTNLKYYVDVLFPFIVNLLSRFSLHDQRNNCHVLLSIPRYLLLYVIVAPCELVLGFVMLLLFIDRVCPAISTYFNFRIMVLDIMNIFYTVLGINYLEILWLDREEDDLYLCIFLSICVMFRVILLLLFYYTWLELFLAILHNFIITL